MSAPLADNEIAVRIAGDVEIVLPASLRVVTTYVLLEQEDWFEEEIRFVRKFVQPGMRAIDIGANFGVYSLSIARAAGPTGQVVAFEPGAGCVACLHKSIARNGFAHMTVQACAVGAASGRARLSVTAPELRTIVETPADASSDEVPVVSLDDMFGDRPPGSVDFVKLDVEGAESDVVRGGARFFAAQAPLILTEVKQTTYEFGHVRLLQEMGYRPYRYVESLQALVPATAVDLNERIGRDGKLLNLFCCKDETALALGRRGLLVREAGAVASRDGVAYVRAQPGFAPLASLADRFDPGRVPGGALYQQALNAYAAGCDASLSLADRFASLEHAGFLLLNAVKAALTTSRHFTAFRILRDNGWTGMATAALFEVWRDMSTGQVNLTEPFLLPLTRHETTPVGREALGGWLAAQVAEAAEHFDNVSSFYMPGTLERIDAVARAGLMTPALERRRQLYRICSGKQTGPEPSELLREGGTLNPDLWDPDRQQRWGPHPL